eukprot:65746-Chlamydomonas_euryale.AAC.2
MARAPSCGSKLAANKKQVVPARGPHLQLQDANWCHRLPHRNSSCCCSCNMLQDCTAHAAGLAVVTRCNRTPSHGPLPSDQGERLFTPMTCTEEGIHVSVGLNGS